MRGVIPPLPNIACNDEQVQLRLLVAITVKPEAEYPQWVTFSVAVFEGHSGSQGDMSTRCMEGLN
jgi:hypothetical protein